VRLGIEGEGTLARRLAKTVRLKRSEVFWLTATQVAHVLNSRGVPWEQAKQRAVAYEKVAAWRRGRRARGEPEGRQPQPRALLRAARRELARLEDEKSAAGEPLENRDHDSTK
jgi:hypothetical protein